MSTTVPVRDIQIYTWSEISKGFDRADLLIGNGFSMNLSRAFSYGALFDKFVARLDAPSAEFFTSFETSNFETIQGILLNARFVNSRLGYDLKRIDDYVRILREGLVSAIEESHPRYGDIDKAQLADVALQLSKFKTIFTLNYDLYLYHMIMNLKDRYERGERVSPLNDYFWKSHSEEFLEFMDHQDYTYYKHVYYLHGALFLFPGPQVNYHNDLKLRRGANSFVELIDLIAGEIREGRFPLFVSEGHHADKLRVIFQSPYLRFAYSRLRKAEDSIVIYGASLSDQDQHIVHALNEKKRNIAVSIHRGSKTDDDLTRDIRNMQLHLYKHELTFFDSATLFRPA